jgi:hypothetical protein
LGEVGLVVGGTIAFESFRVVGVELATWVGFEGPSWVDCLSPWGSANYDSNLDFGQSCWATVKGRGYLSFSRIRWGIAS